MLKCTQDVSHTEDWLDDQPETVDVPADEMAELAELVS